MVETSITFHNRTDMLVQAQIYSGRTLTGSCVAGAGETHTLPAAAAPYDFFCKNAATGWGIARKLDSAALTFTLSQQKGRYTILESNAVETPDLLA